MKQSKGFTLIELLVVIAIIGILASVVLASLSTARARSKDASIRAELTQARNQAELYFTKHGNYGANVGSCTADPTNASLYPWVSQTDPNIFNTPASQGGMKEIVTAVASQISSPSTSMMCATGPYGTAYAGKPTDSWAIYVVLNNGDRICMDASSSLRTYASGVGEYLWNGKCENY